MSKYYKHADCDKAIIDERLDDACEGCRNGMFPVVNHPPTTEAEGLLERIRQAVDDSVLTHTGRSIGDMASMQVAKDMLQLHRLETAKAVQQFAAAIIAGGPEKLGTSKDESDSDYFYGLGNDQAIDQYQAAVTTALEAFLGGVE